jgi:hypothetical protein
MDQKKKQLPICPAWSDFTEIELYMDQVIGVMEKFLLPFFPDEEKCITSTMINNYVKQKILPPPQNKRYSRSHLANLFMICILKRFMQLSDISVLLWKIREKRSEEEAYMLFREELIGSLEAVFEGKGREGDMPRDRAHRVLRTCCDAGSAILYSRLAFLEANWKDLIPADEKEEKKEKKEKKAKEKEKKDSKEKKESSVKEKAKAKEKKK